MAEREIGAAEAGIGAEATKPCADTIKVRSD